MRRLLAIALVLPAFSAAAQQADLIWTGDFEAGTSSLSGNCSAGQNQWCNQQTIRPQQIQTVSSPVAQGRYAARFEVKFGDVYTNPSNGVTYSDSRSLMTGPGTLWEDEGNERWYRWQALWPVGWVGSYPKWDQLATPDARSPAGSLVEWHHEPLNGGTETGSAPLYIGADDSYIWLCLVDPTTNTCRERPNLTLLKRGHWHDFIMHAKWSSDPTVGFLEMWIDGVLVLPRQITFTMYGLKNPTPYPTGTRNYLVVGLYRNGHIGDPNMIWPPGTPLAGQHVYGTDGTPGVAYLDGFVSGTTQAAVLAELPWGPPPPADAGTPPVDGGSPADAGSDAGGPSADAGTPPTDAGTPAGDAGPIPSQPADAGTTTQTATSLAGVGFAGGGCSTGGGAALAWLAFPLLVLIGLRRRR